MFRICAVAIFIVCIVTSLTSAEIPQLLNYQGRLVDKFTKPVSGVKTMQFAFYDDPAAGNLLGGFDETQQVAVTNGVFNVLIGSATVGGVPADVFQGVDVFLSVRVAGEEQLPRRRLVSSAFAFKAIHADTARYAQEATSAGTAAMAAYADQAEAANSAVHSNEADHAASADNAAEATHAALAAVAATAGHANEADHALAADSATEAGHAALAAAALLANRALEADHAAAADNATEADSATEAGHAALAATSLLANRALEADHATAADTALAADSATEAGHAALAAAALLANRALEADHATAADTALAADSATEAGHAALAAAALFANRALEADHAAAADNATEAGHAALAAAALLANRALEADHAAAADNATEADHAALAAAALLAYRALEADHAADADSATFATAAAAAVNAQSVGGQNLDDLDARYVDAAGDTMTGPLTVNAIVKAPAFYDSDSIAFYLNPASHSRLYSIDLGPDVATDDEIGLFWYGSFSYGIYREAGAWAEPYPDLRIAYDAGIKIGADTRYGGIRFYNDTDMTYWTFSVGDGDNNTRVNYDLYLGGRLRDSDSADYFLDLDGSSKLETLEVTGTATIGTTRSGLSYAEEFYDANNNNYYLDPNATSKIGSLDASSISASMISATQISGTTVEAHSFLDTNPAYHLDPDGFSTLKYLDVEQTLDAAAAHIGILYDADNSLFRVDPSLESTLNELSASSVSAPEMHAGIIYDADTPLYYVNPNGDSSMVNIAATVVDTGMLNAFQAVADVYFDDDNAGRYLDPDGISFLQGINVYDNVSVAGNATANVMAAPTVVGDRFEDMADPTYYLDPDGTSILKTLTAGGRVTAGEFSGYQLVSLQNPTYHITPNGNSVLNNLELKGSLTVPPGTRGIPIAYACISLVGDKVCGTPNVHSTYNGTADHYEVTIDNETYNYEEYVTVATASDSDGFPRFAAVKANNGKLIVTIYTLAGDQVQQRFWFVTYKKGT